MDTAGLFPQSIHIPHTKKATSPKPPFLPCPHNERLWRRRGGVWGGEEAILQKGSSPTPIFLVPFLTAALDDHALAAAFNTLCVSMPILLKIIESSFMNAMLISLWLFSITFAASAT